MNNSINFIKSRFQKNSLVIFFLLQSLAQISPSIADDIHFIGTNQLLHRWEMPTSWNTGVLPSKNDRVIINQNISRIFMPDEGSEIGSLWLPDDSPFDNFAYEGMGIITFYGTDGIGVLLESPVQLLFFKRIELANDIIIRANNLNGGGFQMTSLIAPPGLWNGINLNSNSLYFDMVHADNFFNLAGGMIVKGSGDVIKSGAGYLIVGSESEFTGKTIINGGTAFLGPRGSLASSSEIQISKDTALDISQIEYDDTKIKNILGEGNILLGNKNLALTESSSEFSGAISGEGGVELLGGNAIFSGKNTYRGKTNIASGARLTLGNGGSTGEIISDVWNEGVLAFNRADTDLSYPGIISGPGTIQNNGSGTIKLLGNSSDFKGITNVAAGVLSVDGKLGGVMNVKGGRLQGIGAVGRTINYVNGIIAPGNSIGTLTVDGDYSGNGGVLEIESKLGDDASPSDLLLIKGNSSGETGIQIINLNGSGAPTVDGIKIIEIRGKSDGIFSLLGDYSLQGEPAFVAGAYAYQLHKNGIITPDDGNWYLRSVLAPITSANPGDPAEKKPSNPIAPLYQAGVPIYESYAAALLSQSELPYLDRRLGQQQFFDGSKSSIKKDKSLEQGIQKEEASWARIFASSNQFFPKVSTSATHYNIDRTAMQGGIDALLAAYPQGKLFSGINFQYSLADTDVFSKYGTGNIETQAFSLGGTLTWFGEDGFYVDSQAQISWYSSDLNSNTAKQQLFSSNDAIGGSFSLEAGRELALSHNVYLTPQAQLAYTGVSFDKFTDKFGAEVALERGTSMKGRLGVSANYHSSNRDFDTYKLETSLYGIINIYRDFFNDTEISVSDVSSTSEQHKFFGEIGIGGRLKYNNKLSLFGEAAIGSNLSLENDSKKLNATLGVRIAF